MSELDWLFSTCVAPVLSQLQDWMEQCTKIYDQTCSDTSSQPHEWFVLKSKDVDNLTGVVVLRGDMIAKATVKIGRGSSRSAKQEVRHEMNIQTPCYISQLQETMSNVKAALRIIQARRSHLVDIHDAVEVVRLVLSYVKKAHTCLIVPPDDLKQWLEMKSRVSFKPQLPVNELISFVINGSKLVLSCYTLAAVSSSPQKELRRNTVEMGSQLFEVSQQHSVDCHVPWVNHILNILPMALASCQQLLHKISLTSS